MRGIYTSGTVSELAKKVIRARILKVAKGQKLRIAFVELTHLPPHDAVVTAREINFRIRR